jgi:AraC family transcriptional regulator, regulatory protein of adaptative response / methylated-DNA-[protein]-cysteine methyltransferase
MNKTLTSLLLNTPLGTLFCLADEQKIYLLEFNDSIKLEYKINRIIHTTQAVIVPGSTAPVKLLQHELDLYFSHKLRQFTVPLHLTGTSFQKQVWHELQALSYGQTQSYASIAKHIKRPLAYRAVAQANSANYFLLIIPCHRVINANGTLGGYSGDIARKQWLLNHERINTL